MQLLDANEVQQALAQHLRKQRESSRLSLNACHNFPYKLSTIIYMYYLDSFTLDSPAAISSRLVWWDFLRIAR